ncbi:MAG: DUF1292 domain-containing protein [Bacilli bacterium]|nr:DUF1292 domain-containing protein [Bacilli bacterium]
MKKNTFTLLDENGQEVVYDVLFTFQSDETHKDYIVYTDNSRDEEGNIEVYASIYYPEDENGRLEAIETEKEWKLIETILETLREEVQKNANEE